MLLAVIAYVSGSEKRTH